MYLRSLYRKENKKEMLEFSIISQLQDSIDNNKFSEKMQALAECLTLLPEKWRVMVQRRHFSKTPSAEIATELGITSSSLSTNLQRARESLKKCIKGKIS